MSRPKSAAVKDIDNADILNIVSISAKAISTHL